MRQIAWRCRTGLTAAPSWSPGRLLGRDGTGHSVAFGAYMCAPVESMRRLLDTSRLYIVLSVVVGCWHEAFRSSVENGAGNSIQVVIHFVDQLPSPARGRLAPGSRWNLTENVDDIAYIEYQIGGHSCRMDTQDIAESARASKRRMTIVTLRDCSAPSQR